MLYPGGWRRKVRVTLARAFVSLVPLAATAWLLMSIADEPKDAVAFWQNLGAFAVIPVLWWIGGGGVVDHFGSRFGATVTLFAHLIGHIISFFLVLGALYAVALVGGEGLGGPLAFLWVIVVPPYVVAGFLLAWLVPGSFPRRRGLVLDGVRWAWRRLVALGRRGDVATAG